MSLLCNINNLKDEDIKLINEILKLEKSMVMLPSF